MVYGSYLTRLATLQSNLNLALNFPLEYSLGHALSRVMEVLDDTALGFFFFSTFPIILVLNSPSHVIAILILKV